MLAALAVGDEVLTVGGIFGKVTALKDDVVTVEIATNTQVQLQKGAITTVLPKGTLKSA
jgi:preprotein translocase subunit YajC